MSIQTTNSFPVDQGNESIWRVPLVRHLSIVIVIKLTLLFTIWFLFFRQPAGTPEPGSDIHDHIAGPKTAMVSHQHD
ncbi:MAG: hypothetical protein P8X98_09020 [Woeseiaceae bacterium]